MASPLSKMKTNQQDSQSQLAEKWQSVLDQQTAAVQPVARVLETLPQPARRSPLANAPEQFIMPATAIKHEDVEKLGATISRSIGATNEKIVKKMAVGNFEDLGSILVDVSNQANKLDPNSIQKRGIVGWFQRRFGDVKKELTLRLKNADAVFDQLEAKINNHINVHNEWIKDLELLKRENFERYNEIVAVIKTAGEWEQITKDQINNWVQVDVNDPNAAMILQGKVDAENLLKRIQIKKDNFLRWKVVVESNNPQLSSQQETSRTLTMTLKDVIDQTIPLVKMEFTKYIQSLDAKKSIQVVDSARQLANTTLMRSADASQEAAVTAATQLNTPMIQTETLNYMRNSMLETVNKVATIDSQARQTRESDRVTIEQSQQQYLVALQNAKVL